MSTNTTTNTELVALDLIANLGRKIEKTNNQQ